jgi:glycosyltransferase involved in cell wall biosynthesis
MGGAGQGARRALYITYDGIDEPLGRSQVLPYVIGLASRGHQFELLSFEKPGVPLRFREPLADGVRWTALRYHRRPTVPATLLDMASGLGVSSMHRLLRGVDLVHTRSYVPATMALPLVRAAGLPLLFDTRGLWPDEKIDAGAWPAGGGLYRAAKGVERALFRSADAVTVLTHRMQRYLRDEYPYRAELRAPIHVIPTCTDLEHFRPDVPREPALEAELAGACTLLYLGSIGTWYMSVEMARLYLAFRRLVPRARLLVVSREQPVEMARVLDEAGAGAELVHRAARRDEVAGFVRCADAAVCFVRPSFSKQGSAPTKLGELLACGLPVAANVVGDMATVLGDTTAGVVVDDMSDEGLAASAQALLSLVQQPDIAARARGEAERWFRLDEAVIAYDAIYRAMPRRHGQRVAVSDGYWPLTAR